MDIKQKDGPQGYHGPPIKKILDNPIGIKGPGSDPQDPDSKLKDDRNLHY